MKKHVWFGLGGLAFGLCVALVLTSVTADEFSNPGAIGKDLAYEGVLDLNGGPAEGQYNFEFAIYPDATSTSALWGWQTYNNVEVEAGRFSVVFTGLPDKVFEAADAHLKIKVNSQELSGRQKLHSVPFAVRSAHALHADTASGTLAQRLERIEALLVPAGSVTAFAGDTVPAGWLECDGKPYSRSSHPDLFSALSNSSGQPIYGGGGTTFNVPDYRGEFLRGWDHDRGVDPDRGSRTNRGDGTTGDVVGTFQFDQFRSHNHRIYVEGGSNRLTAGGGLNGADFSSLQHNSGSAGGNETRARNVSVMFIIKCGSSDGPCP